MCTCSRPAADRAGFLAAAGRADQSARGDKRQEKQPRQPQQCPAENQADGGRRQGIPEPAQGGEKAAPPAVRLGGGDPFQHPFPAFQPPKSDAHARQPHPRGGGQHDEGDARLRQGAHGAGHHPGVIFARQGQPAAMHQGKEGGQQLAADGGENGRQSQNPAPFKQGGEQQAQQDERRRQGAAQVVQQLPLVQAGKAEGGMP